MNNTPQTLKGFRDFLPEEKRARDLVMGKITQTFQTFGFEPLETPTLEYASLLLGKYGSEADKLVYTFTDRGDRQVGLRYDQTVPTVRVLNQYQNQLPKFFRRYQTQNVFRADKPQQGRYREFTQCDIDIFGSSSPIADAEILACTYSAYKNIGFPEVVIKLNDREHLLATLEPFATLEVSVFSIIQTLDKLDKLPPEVVVAELTNKGLSSASEVLSAVESVAPTQKLDTIIKTAVELGIDANALVFTPTLARGLDYYTGMIFEVIIPGYSGGSVGGGGRYDNLVADLGGASTPAVGMAFGFDRTVDSAKELGLLKVGTAQAQVLVTIFSTELTGASLTAARQLRQAGIRVELYPQADNLGKQFKLANQKQIPFVVVIGESEVENSQVTLKDMTSGEQQQLGLEEVINRLRQ